MYKINFALLLILGSTFTSIKAQLPHSNPQALRGDIAITRVTGVPYPLASRMAYDAPSGSMYYITYFGDVRVIKNFLTSPSDSLLFTLSNHGISRLFGLLVKGKSIFISGSTFNSTNKTFKSYIKKATKMNNGNYTWKTVASTVNYPAAKFFNHLFSGITFNLAKDTIIICSGSRGDHGEVDSYDNTYPNMRSTPLAGIILKIPADSINITLPNNLTQLTNQGRVLAKGVRNVYDFAYNAKGELFAAENSGDADQEDEINWIREGKHYGYPWMMGGTWNPQYFGSFNANTNVMIPHTSYAYINNLFYNDPSFPAPANGTKFMLPLVNSGPDADMLRDTATGTIINASAVGKKCYTLTSHRSPLGLVIDKDSLIGCDLKGDGFVLSWTRGNTLLPGYSDLLAPFMDDSEDLLQLEMTKNNAGTNYNVVAKKIAKNFWHPVDAVQIGNSIYVLEAGDSTEASIWKVRLPAKNACPTQVDVNMQRDYFNAETEATAEVLVYPNPARDFLFIENINERENLELLLYNMNGQLILSQKMGIERSKLSMANLSKGLYQLVVTDYNAVLVREKIMLE